MTTKATVLVVGGGGREHAILWKLAQSPGAGRLYAAPGNAGMAGLAECVPVAADDVAGQVELAKRIGADLVVIGPEAPLALGLVDELDRIGVPAVGPTKTAARIEASKGFAKEVMQAAGIPTAAYAVVTDMDAAGRKIRNHFRAAPEGGTAPLVLKADGLAAGKGVVICHSEEEALDVAQSMLSGDEFGTAGTTVVIEEFLTGTEVSLLAFCDGVRALPMPLVQDYKRVGTSDKGPNTGGMGSVSPVPGVRPGLRDELMRLCVEPLLREMARRGAPFRGILFAGLMLTPDGPKVLEYNARFGDPETQSLLRRMESDLLPVLQAVAEGDLSGVDLEWSEEAVGCVIMAAKGYPGEPEQGTPIEGLPEDGTDGVVVFHGGTARDDEGRLVSAGGRVLGVTAAGTDVAEATTRAYRAVESISFPGSHFRTDIGRDGSAAAANGNGMS